MNFKNFIGLGLILLPLTAGAKLKEFHSHIGLCTATRAELEPDLLKKEMDTVQSDFFCKGNTFATPDGEWDCKPAAKPNAFCKKTYWNCDRRYVCVPEQKGHTREMALKELEEQRARQKPIAKIDRAEEKPEPEPEALAKELARMRGTCTDLSAKLTQCEAFSCRHPHIMMQSFTVEHTITGMEEDRCVYSQTMPNGGRMDCRFKKESLPAFAAKCDSLFKTGVAELKKPAADDPLNTGECVVSGYGQ